MYSAVLNQYIFKSEDSFIQDEFTAYRHRPHTMLFKAFGFNFVMQLTPPSHFYRQVMNLGKYPINSR